MTGWTVDFLRPDKGKIIDEIISGGERERERERDTEARQ